MKIILNRNKVDEVGEKLRIRDELAIKYYELKNIDIFIYQKQQKCKDCGSYQINAYDLMDKNDLENLTGTIKISLEFLGDKGIDGNLISKKKPSLDSILRTDEILILAIKELDEEYPSLRVVEIPDEVEWKIAYKPYHYNDSYEDYCNYELTEYIEEKHRVWGLEE